MSHRKSPSRAAAGSNARLEGSIRQGLKAIRELDRLRLEKDDDSDTVAIEELVIYEDILPILLQWLKPHEPDVPILQILKALRKLEGRNGISSEVITRQRPDAKNLEVEILEMMLELNAGRSQSIHWSQSMKMLRYALSFEKDHVQALPAKWNKTAAELKAKMKLGRKNRKPWPNHWEVAQAISWKITVLRIIDVVDRDQDAEELAWVLAECEKLHILQTVAEFEASMMEIGQSLSNDQSDWIDEMLDKKAVEDDWCEEMAAKAVN